MANPIGSYKISPSNGIDQPTANQKAANQKTADERPKTAWGRIYLCTLLTFSSSVQFTMFLTSMWPFMRVLDKSVTVGFFGLVIAMYSLSQIIASPILGIWSNRIGKMKPPLIFCNLAMFVGNLMYFLIELFPSEYSRYVMIFSRLIAGIGWAQVGLLKSFASVASVPKDRTKATAYITGGVAMGVTLGPALQMLFTFIDYPGVPLRPFGTSFGLNFSMFTAPALFASLFNITLIVLMMNFFHESYVGLTGAPKRAEKKNDGTVEDTVCPALPPYDRWAIGVCYAMRFTQYFIYTNLETNFGIGTAYAMMMFLWTPEEVVFYESIAHSLRGVIALFVYVSYIFFDLGKRVNDRLCCLCSLGALLLFHLVTFSWPFLPENVQKFDSTFDNSSSVPSNGSLWSLGCDISRMNWCEGMTRVNVWVYYVAIIFCIGVAFSNINVTMNTLFSHIIGPRMQSKQQGMLEMYGGVGRMLGPLLIGFLYLRYGPRAIWLMEIGEVLLMITLWLIFYRRLVPLKIPDDGWTDRESTASDRKQRIAKQSFTGSIT